jgi:hypothetical protein
MKEPLDHLRSRKKPVRKSVWIAGDSELADELSELEASLSRARTKVETYQTTDPRREAALQVMLEIEENYDAKKKQTQDSAIKFTFESIGTKPYEALLAAHPPTDAQIKQLKEQGEDQVPFNPDTLPMALVVASCVEPEMDKEELKEWLSDDTWNSIEFMSLFMAATEVNNTRRILNLGKG